jgi:hypothetical protein
MRFIDAWTRVLLRAETKKPSKKEEMVLERFCRLLERYVEKCPLGTGQLKGIHFCGYRGTPKCPFFIEQGDENP